MNRVATGNSYSTVLNDLMRAQSRQTPGRIGLRRRQCAQSQRRIGLPRTEQGFGQISAHHIVGRPFDVGILQIGNGSGEILAMELHSASQSRKYRTRCPTRLRLVRGQRCLVQPARLRQSHNATNILFKRCGDCHCVSFRPFAHAFVER